jgi:hypothetical protein
LSFLFTLYFFRNAARAEIKAWVYLAVAKVVTSSVFPEARLAGHPPTHPPTPSIQKVRDTVRGSNAVPYEIISLPFSHSALHFVDN